MSHFRRSPATLVLVALATVFASSLASAASSGQGVDLLPVLEALVIVLIAGKLGGELFAVLRPAARARASCSRAWCSATSGSCGFYGLEGLSDQPAIDLLAQIGVLFLLFGSGSSRTSGR